MSGRIGPAVETPTPTIAVLTGAVAFAALSSRASRLLASSIPRLGSVFIEPRPVIRPSESTSAALIFVPPISAARANCLFAVVIVQILAVSFNYTVIVIRDLLHASIERCRFCFAHIFCAWT